MAHSRLFTALLTASIGAALTVTVIARQPFVFVFAFPVALAHALLIALPAYLLLSLSFYLTLPRALVGGFLVGAAPVSLLFLGYADPGEAVPWRDIYQIAWVAGALGMFGLGGGFGFWLVMRSGADFTDECQSIEHCRV